MNSRYRITKRLLTIVLVGTAVISMIVWFGLHQRNRSAVQIAEQTEAAPTQAVSETAPAPEAVSNALESIPTLTGELPPVIPISLAPFFAEPENGVWSSKPWSYFSIGTQTYCGVEFNIQGVIQLGSPGSVQSKRLYRGNVTVSLAVTNFTDNGMVITELGTNIGCIHLLGATRYSGEATPGMKIAEVVWHYANSDVRRTPVEYAVHTRDWKRVRFEQPGRVSAPGAKVVWRADERAGDDRNMRLYRFALANPAPGHAVKQLEFRSAMANAALFFTALTLDPLKLGQRPDDSPDLEETDPPPARTLEILVQDSTGRMIPGARVRSMYELKQDGKTSRVNKSLVTDANGVCVFKFADADMEKLELSAWQEESETSGRKMVWETRAGDIIPVSYTFKLGNGITIGGLVVDESDIPIAEAKLNFYRFWTGSDEMNKRGDHPDFSNRNATTDAQGRWQMKGLPPEMLDRIGFEVKHPDFTGTSMNVGGSATDEAKFRNGTHKIVLKRGLIVRGKVTDEFNSPIKDAQVWAGDRNTRERQDKRTDTNGEFRFTNIKEGDVRFSVMAKGRTPEVKTATVKPDMPEIIFKLIPGKLIRALVQNVAGEPLPGTRVSLESPTGGVAESYEFNTTTDTEGRFEWDGAPDEPVQFYFYKEGYEQKRGQRLKQNEDNIVTLRKGRNVQGWVVDSDTQKPITKFRVGVGRNHEAGTSRFYADYPGMKDYSDANGAFTVALNEEQNNAIKAEADDYAEKVEQLPAAENGVVQIVLKLKPSSALRGVLVNPQGAPVPGATVALTEGDSIGSSFQLRNGRLSSYDRSSKLVTTDASGNFTLPSPPETGGDVVASSESGFARASVAQVRGSGQLVLQGFGRIEGTIKIGGQPVAGQEFGFSMQNIGISPDWQSYKTSSDEQGRFSFDKVPAGESSVIRLIKNSDTSWTHSHKTPVVVEAGKTAQVSFGDDGAVIKGQVLFETPLPEGEKMNFSGSLNTKMPDPPRNFSSPQEAQAFYNSPEWKALTKQAKHFAVSISPDGTLVMDSIPPGEYTLRVMANKPGTQLWDRKTAATGTMTVTIPENANPFSPINIGEIILKPVQKQ
ncbi:MAG: carboxypeptidase regulatory-like domain-containing protein [Verrucomicrobia bacterium]|nr:carboxypeptidase regulatory-like domain-containing protein [Verrucomicrobiota bacterium]